jgi:cell division protein FtsB
MAKAILGHMNTLDPRVAASLSAENRRLRQRVTDLEEHVRRLQLENDALAAAAVDPATLLTVPEQMQPA